MVWQWWNTSTESVWAAFGLDLALTTLSSIHSREKIRCWLSLIKYLFFTILLFLFWCVGSFCSLCCQSVYVCIGTLAPCRVLLSNAQKWWEQEQEENLLYASIVFHFHYCIYTRNRFIISLGTDSADLLFQYWWIQRLLGIRSMLIFFVQHMFPFESHRMSIYVHNK